MGRPPSSATRRPRSVFSKVANWTLSMKTASPSSNGRRPAATPAPPTPTPPPPPKPPPPPARRPRHPPILRDRRLRREVPLPLPCPQLHPLHPVRERAVARQGRLRAPLQFHQPQVPAGKHR